MKQNNNLQQELHSSRYRCNWHNLFTKNKKSSFGNSYWCPGPKRDTITVSTFNSTHKALATSSPTWFIQINPSTSQIIHDSRLPTCEAVYSLFNQKKKEETGSLVCYYLIPLSISHSHEWCLCSMLVVENRAWTCCDRDECWLTVWLVSPALAVMLSGRHPVWFVASSQDRVVCSGKKANTCKTVPESQISFLMFPLWLRLFHFYELYCMWFLAFLSHLESLLSSFLSGHRQH